MRELGRLIDEHLFSALVENDRPETLVETVVDAYMGELRITGQLSAQFEDDVREEMREIALEMIRKRTYGYMTIGDFQSSGRRSSQKR